MADVAVCFECSLDNVSFYICHCIYEVVIFFSTDEALRRQIALAGWLGEFFVNAVSQDQQKA